MVFSCIGFPRKLLVYYAFVVAYCLWLIYTTDYILNASVKLVTTTLKVKEYTLWLKVESKCSYRFTPPLSIAIIGIRAGILETI
jgi:hypothetical protein